MKNLFDPKENSLDTEEEYDYDYESRIVDRTARSEDSESDAGLRPKALGEYIGQEKTKQNLKIYIDAAKHTAFLCQKFSVCLSVGGTGCKSCYISRAYVFFKSKLYKFFYILLHSIVL